MIVYVDEGMKTAYDLLMYGIFVSICHIAMRCSPFHKVYSHIV